MKENSFWIDNQYSLTLIDNLNDFYPLKSTWDDLAHNQGNYTPFLNFDWFRLWFQHFLKDERLIEERSREAGDQGKTDERMPRTVPYLGVNAESLPPEVLDSSGTAVNLGAHTAMLHAAVKELSTRVREQQVEIDELRRRLDALEQMQ